MWTIWPWERRAAWSPLRKPLDRSTLALVCSNAYLADPRQRLGPFAYECRFRSVDATAHGPEPDGRRLDGVDAARKEERLLAVLDRVRPLVDAGRLGRLSPRHLSLSGAVVSPRRLIAATRHQAMPQLTDDEVDVVLLVPT